ncbi:MAG: TetR/AcrR family transcriptional regulator [Steroidobacteraceae bacterium]
MKTVRKRGRPVARSALRDELFNMKRDRILAEAATLFYEQGYLPTTVSAIAKRLGVTKPFVYYHFHSKVDLLVEICERATRDALVAIEKAASMNVRPLEQYESFVRAFTSIVISNHAFVAVYFREELNLPVESAARINAMRKAINRRLVDLLTRGVRAGDFEVEDPGMSALMITGMASYAFAWYRGRGRLDPGTMTDEIVRMAIKLVRKGG